MHACMHLFRWKVVFVSPLSTLHLWAAGRRRPASGHRQPTSRRRWPGVGQPGSLRQAKEVCGGWMEKQSVCLSSGTSGKRSFNTSVPGRGPSLMTGKIWAMEISGHTVILVAGVRFLWAMKKRGYLAPLPIHPRTHSLCRATFPTLLPNIRATDVTSIPVLTHR